jgi:uncharacterized DUF497 family protein
MLPFERDRRKRAANPLKHGLDVAGAPPLLAGKPVTRPTKAGIDMRRCLAVGRIGPDGITPV